MASTSEIVIALGAAGAVVFGAYSLGQVHASEHIPNSFVPQFGDGEVEDFMCYVLAEKVRERVVYRGCYAAAVVEQMHSNYRDIGQPFPYAVIATFDREQDDI